MKDGKCVDFAGGLDVTPIPSIYTNLFPTDEENESDGIVGNQDFSMIQTESNAILTEILPSTTSEAIKFTSESLKQMKKNKQKARKDKRKKFRFRKNQRMKG